MPASLTLLTKIVPSARRAVGLLADLEDSRAELRIVGAGREVVEDLLDRAVD